jgi:TonB family protein
LASCADSTPEQKRHATAEPASVGTNTAGVTPEEVDAVNASFRRKTPDLQRCWDAAYEKTHDRTLQGDVTIGFTITTTGALRDVKVLQSSMGNPDVDACVGATAAKWNFPTVSAELPYTGRVHLGAQF